MYIQYLGEIVPPPRHNTVGVSDQIFFLVFYYNSSRLVPLLEVINAPIQVPDILNLTVSFEFLNFSFQICLLFVPEMSASITSYIVQIIYIASAWIPYALHFSLLPLIYEIYTFLIKPSSYNPRSIQGIQ